MQREEYLMNRTYTVEILTLIDPNLASMMSTIIIFWMYFILSLDNQIDFIIRLFNSNRFIL